MNDVLCPRAIQVSACWLQGFKFWWTFALRPCECYCRSAFKIELCWFSVVGDIQVWWCSIVAGMHTACVLPYLLILHGLVLNVCIIYHWHHSCCVVISGWFLKKDASQCNDQFSPGFQAVPKSLLKYWLFLSGSVSKIFQTLHDGNPC